MRPVKLNAPQNFINRELSWIEFNNRVLYQGLDERTPLLERLKFLGIVSSNLDEFFMVRVGGLEQLRGAGDRRHCPAGMTPRQQLIEIRKRTLEMTRKQYDCLSKDIFPALECEGIRHLHPDTLDAREAEAAERRFHEEVFPVLTPIAVESRESCLRIAGLTLHLVARLRKADAPRSKDVLAVIPLPGALPRFAQIPSKTGHHFLLLEELVARHAHRFFPGFKIIETATFRLTRNADMSVDDDADDLLDAMQGLLSERKAGAPVRLEIQASASQTLVRRLAKCINIDTRSHLYRLDGPLDLKPFIGFAAQQEHERLSYPPYKPQPVGAFAGAVPVWDVLRERDVLVHLPYESFDPVIQVLNEAADDPQVMAIKQTLYRTSGDSPIIAALERAALNGKLVTVLVELKARFDEARNIGWARRLSEAGAQVIYGVLGLKTHAKSLMIVRREADGVRRYCHLSTGNYHDSTARLYEDVGLFTSDPDIGADVANFFNAVTGYSEARDWRQCAIAPTGMRQRIEEMIEREIALSSKEDPGLIMIKMNSLLDTDLSALLYEASRKGVRVKVCVRGICCLRPGVKGLSENIEVTSIVGRYLEHSRVFYFRNGGDEEVHLSSADWMPRNLDRRVEIMFPVQDEQHRDRLIDILRVVFSDNERAWRLGQDGAYALMSPGENEAAQHCQDSFMAQALERAEAIRLRQMKRFKPKGPGVAPGL